MSPRQRSQKKCCKQMTEMCSLIKNGFSCDPNDNDVFTSGLAHYSSSSLVNLVLRNKSGFFLIPFYLACLGQTCSWRKMHASDMQIFVIILNCTAGAHKDVNLDPLQCRFSLSARFLEAAAVPCSLVRKFISSLSFFLSLSFLPFL